MSKPAYQSRLATEAPEMFRLVCELAEAKPEDIPALRHRAVNIMARMMNK